MERSRLETYWAGLAILDHLASNGATLGSEEVREMLGARSTKGIGAALSHTRWSLECEGIRLDEALRRRTVGGRSAWSAGPRIAQARHALARTRRSWLRGEREAGADIIDVSPGYRGPVLVLGSLKLKVGLYLLEGGMNQLEATLDDEWFALDNDCHELLGEIFIERIEPGEDGVRHAVPEGYEENGVWVRGLHDHADPRVASAIGTGRQPEMGAQIGEAVRVEGRIVLSDATEQVETLAARLGIVRIGEIERWSEIDPDERFRYVRWIEPGVRTRRRGSARPLRLRLRCWYDITIETGTGKRAVLHEEGLRGDEARTTHRAIERWRRDTAHRAGELVVVKSIRIAKRQPRPSAPHHAEPPSRGRGRKFSCLASVERVR